MKWIRTLISGEEQGQEKEVNYSEEFEPGYFDGAHNKATAENAAGKVTVEVKIHKSDEYIDTEALTNFLLWK